MMQLEDLNKKQVVLLTLFLSFVTSMASGVVTAALIFEPADEAQPVTQTINRVVERTIERVVPGAAVVREVKVPVPASADEAVVSVLANAEKALVQVLSTDEEGIRAGGFLVAPQGVVLTTARAAEDRSRALVVRYRDGTTVAGEVLAVNVEENFALVRPVSIPGGTALLSFAATPPVVGQSLLAPALAAKDRSLTAAFGFVSTAAGGVSFSDRTPSAGSPIMTIRGDVVGMAAGGGMVVPADTIVKAFELVRSAAGAAAAVEAAGN